MKKTLLIMFLLVVVLCILDKGIGAYYGRAHGQVSEWKQINDESVALYRQKRYEQSATVAKKAVEIAEQKFGPNDNKTATSLNNLAVAYDSQKLYTQAEPIYKRALGIKEKTLGPNHPEVAATLENMAELYRAMGQGGAAVDLDKRAAAIRAKK
jgi:tetratricopeptide (TPR) repeat protein